LVSWLRATICAENAFVEPAVATAIPTTDFINRVGFLPFYPYAMTFIGADAGAYSMRNSYEMKSISEYSERHWRTGTNSGISQIN
jgi:hypothetical protein